MNVALYLYLLLSSTYEKLAPMVNSGEAFGESYQKIAIGGWRYTADFASIDETSSSNNNMGVYLLGERQLFREYSDPAQGLSCFANVGFANSTYNQIGLFYSAGAVYSGVFPGRDADAVGIAVATVRSGTPFRQWMIQTGQPVENAETAIELITKSIMYSNRKMIMWVMIRGATTLPLSLSGTIARG